MKFSDAMLEGFKRTGGEQCRDRYCTGDSKQPDAVCVRGAAQLALNGDAMDDRNRELDAAQEAFRWAWGEWPAVYSDAGLHWTEIYGMARAIGL